MMMMVLINAMFKMMNKSEEEDEEIEGKLISCCRVIGR